MAGAFAAGLVATFVGSTLAYAGVPIPAAGARRIGCIDGLRGYLALSVLACHFVIWMQVIRLGGGWSHPSVALFDSFGSGGIALFFMTTGCLFYPRVLAGFRRTSWTATYIRRVFRIIPLIVASVVLVTAVLVWRSGSWPDRHFPLAALSWITSWDQPSLVAATDSGRVNAYVLWSLRYEWLFYLLVLPACALGRDMLRARWPTWVLPAALLAASLSLQIVRPREIGITAYIPFFATGMIAFECQTRDVFRAALRSRWIAFPACACLLIAMTTASHPSGIAQLPFYGFFFICIACGNDLGGLLRTHGARLLGECSYGIYLLHGTVLSLMFTEGEALAGRLPTAWLPMLMPAAALLVTLVATSTYLLIERPAVRTGAAITNHLTDRRVRSIEARFSAE